MRQALKAIVAMAALLAVAAIAEGLPPEEWAAAWNEFDGAKAADDAAGMRTVVDRLKAVDWSEEAQEMRGIQVTFLDAQTVAKEQSPTAAVALMEQALGQAESDRARQSLTWYTASLASLTGLRDVHRTYLKRALDICESPVVRQAALQHWLRDYAEGPREKATYAIRALVANPAGTSPERAAQMWQQFYAARVELTSAEVVQACEQVLLAYIPVYQDAAVADALLWQEFLAPIKLIREELK